MLEQAIRRPAATVNVYDMYGSVIRPLARPLLHCNLCPQPRQLSTDKLVMSQWTVIAVGYTSNSWKNST